jgi:hypothetical protein
MSINLDKYYYDGARMGDKINGLSPPTHVLLWLLAEPRSLIAVYALG